MCALRSVEATPVDLTALPHSQPNLGIESSISPTSVPSTSKNREPGGTCTNVSKGTHLITFQRNPDKAAREPTQSVTGAEHDKQLKSLEDTIRNPTATYKSGSNWKSTAYATTKLVINLLKESADAFPPLKSAVGGVSAILDPRDVRFIFHTDRKSVV